MSSPLTSWSTITKEHQYSRKNGAAHKMSVKAEYLSLPWGDTFLGISSVSFNPEKDAVPNPFRKKDYLTSRLPMIPAFFLPLVFVLFLVSAALNFAAKNYYFAVAFLVWAVAIQFLNIQIVSKAEKYFLETIPKKDQWQEIRQDKSF
ncbi:MAG TPA: hypothetical protein VMW41_02880 [Candidatus Bathyarchaeia archaeon]|nr:hypothetical protein [Candidatus Bathyarchaeia archaeon]